MEDSRPEISVIITVYDRKKFIRECVESVLNQTTSRDRYEIIVVKNFEDADLDAYLSSERIGIIQSSHKGLGDKIAQASSYAKGEIIAFLEDDDLFSPSKIMWLIDTFKSLESVGYLHNKQNYITESGNEIQIWHGKSGGKSTLVRKPITHHKTVRHLLMDKHNGHNMSSWAIRKNEFERIIPHFKGLTYNIDALMLYESLNSASDALFSGEAVTFYRRYSSATSIEREASSINLENKRMIEMSLAEYENLLNTFSSTAFLPFIANSQKYFSLRNKILSKHPISFRESLSFFISSIKSPSFKYVEYAVIFSILFLYRIFPKVGISFYLRVSNISSKVLSDS